MAAKNKKNWFTVKFGLNLAQYEIPFVDFRTDRDVPLYIDPFAITKEPSDLAANCHNSITSYFQQLTVAIKKEDTLKVKRLVTGHLAEPTQIHFGSSKKVGGGRGIGKEQEQQIITALTKSTALKTGLISSLQELELHIEGIGPDKISDLVANIILGHLAQYTEEICAEYGISTQECTVDGFWNEALGAWDAGYFNLPVINSDSFILVPRRFVRKQKDLMNHRVFYEKYVLTILQQKLLSADDSLVQTLKHGERRVTKKSIELDSRFELTKEFISDFINKNPKIIENYRNDLIDKSQPTDPSLESGKAEQDDPLMESALGKLPTIQPGKKDATIYHNLIKDLIEFTFDWCLGNFTIEYKMDAGRSRIDILSDNNATDGIFRILRDQFRARTIPMECKNYNNDLGNEEFNQIAERMGNKTSNLGFIFCRKINNKETTRRHQTSRYLREKKAIIVLDDLSVHKLAEMRLKRDFKGISQWISSQLRDIEYGHPF